MISNKVRVIVITLVITLFISGYFTAAFGQEKNEIFSVTPKKLNFGIKEINAVTPLKLCIESKDTYGSAWTAAVSRPWIILDKKFGYADEVESCLTISVDKESTLPGRNVGRVIVYCGNSVTSVPVEVTIKDNPNDSLPKQLRKLELRPSIIDALPSGRKKIVQVFGISNDGSEVNVSNEAQWISKNENIAEFIESGLLVGKKAGVTEVHAAFGDLKSLPVPVKVENGSDSFIKVSSENSGLGRIENFSTKSLKIRIDSYGKYPVQWTVQCTEPWLYITGKDFKSDIANNAISGIEKKPSAPESQKDFFRLYSGTGKGSRTFSVIVDAGGLSAGEHEGHVLIKSPGGDEVIPVSCTVATLEAIKLFPAFANIPAGERRLFSAAGLLSDGSRVDMSETSEGRWILSDPSIGAFMRHKPVFVAKKPGITEIVYASKEIESQKAFVIVSPADDMPTLRLTPQEIDLGKIGPGEMSKGQVILEKVGSGRLNWHAGFLENWDHNYEKKLTGYIEGPSNSIEISVRSLDEQDKSGNYEDLFPIQLEIKNGNNINIFKKFLMAGRYRDSIKLYFNDEFRTLFIAYEISTEEYRPSIEVTPLGLDLGEVEEGNRYIKRIRIRNDGKSLLSWNVKRQNTMRSFYGLALPNGRYVSFVNGSLDVNESYRTPLSVSHTLDIWGRWYNYQGLPYSSGEGDVLNYTFSGTGIALFFWKRIDGGLIRAYVDDRFITEIDCTARQKERVECLIAEGLEDGRHSLKLIAQGDGAVIVEGVRISGKKCSRGYRKTITLSPDKGTTKGESDYVTVAIDPSGLQPGCYSDCLLFDSDGGKKIVEISFDVIEKNVSGLIKIVTFMNDKECILVPENATENGKVPFGYEKKGVSFMLFEKGTPGTTEFYEWHNPVIKDRFYTAEKTKVKILSDDYSLEGSIGNIAVVPLPETRELYRFYNPELKRFAFTTELKMNHFVEKGYKYDGIAGYVR
ncbi:MAG: hypothetical protein M0P57_09180 [Syntrophales bacterium]|jgi:hypothetical protein|nr:hypothetical protein [Syntrophales bacterium]MDY0045009.1 hypothetical protein [Syntrophales bacterium]